MEQSLFVCRYEKCYKYFDKPVILPCCQRAICMSHLVGDKIYCNFCKKEQEIPKEGLEFNAELLNGLNSNKHLIGKQKEVKILNDNLNNVLNECNRLVADSIIYIDNYFADIRNKIEQKRNALKARIDSIADKFLEKINQFESECNASHAYKLENEEKEFDELTEYFVKRWHNELRATQINDKKLNELKTKIENKLKQNQLKLNDLKSKIFNNKLIQLDSLIPATNSIILDDNLFGKMLVTNEKQKVANNISQNILAEHTSYVNFILISNKDPNRLLSASSDFLIKIWDLQKGECVHTLKEHTGPVYCMIQLPNGNLISGSFDNTIKIWDLNSMRCVNTLKGHTFDINCMELLPNTNQLITGSSDKSIRIWSLSTYKCVSVLRGHTSGILGLKLKQNKLSELQLISSSFDTTIRVWDLGETVGDECCKSVLTGHASYVRCLELLKDGKLLSGSQDKSLKIWNLESGECLMTLDDDEPVLCFTILTEDLVVCGYASKNQNIKIWDLTSKRKIKFIKAHGNSVRCLRLNENKTHLLSASEDRTIKIWDI